MSSASCSWSKDIRTRYTTPQGKVQYTCPSYTKFFFCSSPNHQTAQKHTHKNYSEHEFRHAGLHVNISLFQYCSSYVTLFQSGRSEDILSSLINQGFPPTIATKDQQVDYLLVLDSEQVTPDHQNGQTRTKNSIDHGCYDHSLLMEANNKEVKVGGREIVEQGYSEGLKSTFRKTKSLSTDVTSLPCPQKKPFNNVTETPKQAPISRKYRSLSHHKDLWDSLARQHLEYRETVVKSQSNCDDKHNLSSQNIVTPSKAIGCVEVQRWTKSIGLQVLVPEMDKRQEDYSKVSVVENDNVLLLKRETVPLNCTSCKVRGNQSEKCLQRKPCKPNMTVPAKEGVHVGSNGYVEPVTISHIL